MIEVTKQQVAEGVMWTREEALRVVTWLEPKLAENGFHVALAGGVLTKGTSKKDLDLIVYPHEKGGPLQPAWEHAWSYLQKWLHAESLGECHGVSQNHDDKIVCWLQARGKRIDFFFLS